MFRQRVHVELSLRLSECQWGTLGMGHHEKPAAIIYMDLRIRQFNAVKLENVSILVSKEQSQANKNERDIPQEYSNSTDLVQFTQHFGAKVFSSTLMSRPSTPLRPFAGLSSKVSIENDPRSTSPALILGGITHGQDASNSRYQSLRWDLEENPSQDPVSRSDTVVLLGFAIEHTMKPFALMVEVTANPQGRPFEQWRCQEDPIPFDPRILHQAHLRLDEAVLALPGSHLFPELEVDESPTTRAFVLATYLLKASCDGDIEEVRNLLEDRAGTDLEDEDGRTALSWAAGNGHLNVVESLLNHHDVSDKADKHGKTALAWAAQEGHEDIVQAFLLYYHTHGPLKEGGDTGFSRLQIIDNIIKTPLELAAQHGHVEIISFLIQAGYIAIPSSCHADWISGHLRNAIENGVLSVVKKLFLYGARVNMKFGKPGESQVSPLCLAAKYGHVNIIHFLLGNRAPLEEPADEGETALFFAVRASKEEAVEALLDRGANVDHTNSAGQTVKDIVRDSTTILRMISEKARDRNLANEDPYPISQEFNARVAFFTTSPGRQKLSLKSVPVRHLLENPNSIQPPQDSKDGEVSFKWFHLPANNMRWVEVLLSKLINNPFSVSHILKSDRWVGRQHQGEGNAHQARFMRPLCQAFGATVDPGDAPEERTLGDENVVLFMPYLHWERNKQLARNKAIIGHGMTQKDDQKMTKDERLLHTYLFDKGCHPLHLLHIRRTLDQFYYHTLNTDKRDQNQAVSRYQKKVDDETKVTIMADQLWCWVIVGNSGQADTVITCFPTRDDTWAKYDSQRTLEPDPDGFTDVLQNITSYILNEPQAIRTAYDLAGVITINCSKVFLRPSMCRRIPRFAEVYESAISNIVNKETELFDRFSGLNELHRKGEEARKALESSEKKSVSADTSNLLAQDFYSSVSGFDVPDAEDVSALLRNREFTSNQISQILQKIYNLSAVNISREIMLLREVKDIQDELNIMAMVFEDQMGVIKEMEGIVRSIEKVNSENVTRDVSLARLETNFTNPPAQTTEMSTSTNAELARTDQNIHARRHVSNNLEDTRPESEIWGSSGHEKYSSRPAITVRDSVEAIDKMAQRAAKANQALDFLVDLKQKESNILEAHSARQQAEQSLEMAKQGGKTGKTTTFFTIVTIVFLPLTFIAAFFTIPITEFKRNDQGTLDLGYVSGIMIPLSTTMSLVLICIAFQAGSFERTFRWIWGEMKQGLQSCIPGQEPELP